MNQLRCETRLLTQIFSNYRQKNALRFVFVDAYDCAFQSAIKCERRERMAFEVGTGENKRFVRYVKKPTPTKRLSVAIDKQLY